MKRIDPNWAWQTYSPSDDAPWSLAKAGHLLRRAAFGGNWNELQLVLKDGPHKSIDRLLNATGDGPAFPDSIKRGNVGAQLPAWWLKRIHETPAPLAEKMTLFWHNHFATSNAKVNNTGYMLGMYDLLHRHALGDFRTMLQEISQDPAMLIWLDGQDNKRGKANENYARELMELFSLGIGNYTENDIREAAKAFTGWELRDGKPSLNRGQHDTSSKTVLGRTGPFKSNDVVQICLEQKACPLFITTKLFRFLVSETIQVTPELLAPLAEQYRSSGFDNRKLVETMLRSNLFFSDQAYRSRIKSPVEFAIGIVRALEGNVSMLALADSLEGLGQRLFYPPSVKGWDGGTTWLNGQTVLFRQNLSLALSSTEDDRFRSRCDPAALARRHGQSEGVSPVGFFLKLLLQDDVPAESSDKLSLYFVQARKQPAPAYWPEEQSADAAIRAVCHLAMTLPEFQLC